MAGTPSAVVTGTNPGSRAGRIATAATAAYVAILALVTLLALDRVVEGKINDFYGYWDAARTVIEGRPLGEAWGIVWMPLLTYIILPLGLIPLLASAAAWTLVNALLAAFLCHVAAAAAVRASGGAPDTARVPVVRLVALVVMLPPIRNVMYEGQFDLLLALLCTLAIAGLASGRRVGPAAGVVAAAVVKWSSVALLPWMMVRRPLSVLWAAAFAAVAAFAPALILGIPECMAQLRRALSGPVAATAPYLTMPDRWSLTNGLGRIANAIGISPHAGRWSAIGACAALAALFLWQYRLRGVRWFGTKARAHRPAVRPSTLLAEGAAMMALPLAIHPHVATRHAVVMVLPAAILAAALVARASRSSARLAAAGIAVMAITWYMPYPVRGWWQWAGGPALAVLASAAIALWTQLPARSRGQADAVAPEA
ncbi:MAG: DUF2029 domain-containing protein [Phycisphaerales bacterium]|nr:DUF2029 domain-containing protein [Phycisphaerales bacterium]